MVGSFEGKWGKKTKKEVSDVIKNDKRWTGVSKDVGDWALWKLRAHTIQLGERADEKKTFNIYFYVWNRYLKHSR